jgi:hypothetical protein
MDPCLTYLLVSINIFESPDTLSAAKRREMRITLSIGFGRTFPKMTAVGPKDEKFLGKERVKSTVDKDIREGSFTGHIKIENRHKEDERRVARRTAIGALNWS